MDKFYFTFGTDPLYPFGINDYVVVEANGINEACALFNLAHPPREGSELVNCAFIYSEEKFNKNCAQYYPGVYPKEIIRLQIMRN